MNWNINSLIIKIKLEILKKLKNDDSTIELTKFNLFN